MPKPETSFALEHHPLTPAPMVAGVSASVCRQASGELQFNYRLCGDMARLRVPAPRSESRADGLWAHTCCEAFIALAGKPAYWEFNFSPSGQWAAYAFSAYRVLAGPAPSPAPRIDARLTPGRLELTATIAAAALPAEFASEPLLIGLAAVVESADTVDGERSYWALRHLARAPDFHDRDAFIIELPACGTRS